MPHDKDERKELPKFLLLCPKVVSVLSSFSILIRKSGDESISMLVKI